MAKKHFNLNQLLDNVSYPIKKGCTIQLRFDKVFDDHFNENDLFKITMVPLLLSVYDDGKDASLIAWGCKNTGFLIRKIFFDWY